MLFLNAKNMLLANEALWQGSVDEASVHVREVIARAIALGATASSSSTTTRAATRAQPAGHPPDPRPGRGRAPHEGHRPRPRHRRRVRPHQHARDGTDLKLGFTALIRTGPGGEHAHSADVVEPDRAIADHHALVACRTTIEPLIEDRPPDPRRENPIVVAPNRRRIAIESWLPTVRSRAVEMRSGSVTASRSFVRTAACRRVRKLRTDRSSSTGRLRCIASDREALLVSRRSMRRANTRAGHDDRIVRSLAPRSFAAIAGAGGGGGGGGGSGGGGGAAA